MNGISYRKAISKLSSLLLDFRNQAWAKPFEFEIFLNLIFPEGGGLPTDKSRFSRFDFCDRQICTQLSVSTLLGLAKALFFFSQFYPLPFFNILFICPFSNFNFNLPFQVFRGDSGSVHPLSDNSNYWVHDWDDLADLNHSFPRTPVRMER